MRSIAFFRLWINEIKGDIKLRIKTTGRDESQADRHHQPYEPTPYAVLKRLAAAGYIGEDNTLVDYGCGKGRVPFFFSSCTGCRTIGIECDESFYADAIENQGKAAWVMQTSFVLEDAECYSVPPQADRFFFFNPFSVETLQKVLEQIRKSYDAAPRRMLLFFYYPSEKYTAYLKTVEGLWLLEDMDCTALFQDGDQRERILVYELQLPYN